MFQLQELDQIKAAVDKLDHWDIAMPSETDDDELQFELTPSVSFYDAKVIVSVTSFNAFAKEVVALADGFDPDYEASLWIGPDGHGANGAPYHIRGRMVMVPTVPRITSATSWMTWMPSKVRTTNWLTPSVRL